MFKKKTSEPTAIVINEIETEVVKFNVVGTSPLIMHRFASKAWQELLFPSPEKNKAERAQTLKHDPLAEYRECMYRNRDAKRQTLFHLPNGMFHGAMTSAAIDMPGAKRAQMERLTRVTDVNIDLYGVPQMFMAMVRNSDMARTPDVRTRAIFPQYACSVSVRYVRGMITQRAIANLFGAAGFIVGIGDWRPQRGGPYGSYRLVADNDKEFVSITRNQGRAAQQAAYDNPTYYDDDTRDLMRWFQAELTRREKSASAPVLPKTRRVVTVGGNGGDERYMGAEQ